MLQHISLANQRFALLANAIFSGLCGATALAAQGRLADTLGIEQPWIVAVLGVMLVGYSIMLVWTSTRRTVDQRVGCAVVVMDVGWVVGSGLLLAMGRSLISDDGRLIVGALAIAVGTFAIWQAYALRQT